MAGFHHPVGNRGREGGGGWARDWYEGAEVSGLPMKDLRKPRNVSTLVGSGSTY
jgi:hypothetical protein